METTILKTVNVKFDENQPDLRHSKYKTPSFGWVDGIRKKFPEIWETGENSIADDAFYTWKDYQDGKRSESTDAWLLKREKWANLHKNDGISLIGKKTSPTLAKQVVNMVKWGVVGEIGLDNMIEVISDMIDGNVESKNFKLDKTYGDYPETAIDNAKKALAWKDEHSERNKESIWEIAEKYVAGAKFSTLELRTIARFESQKEHAGKKYKTIEPVLYDAVGGTNGIIWAKRIVQALDNSKKKVYKKLAKAAANALSTGDFVSWNSSGGNAQGKITRIERNGKIDVPNSSLTITGTADDPAALITVYRDGEPSDVQVGHKFSTLTKIAAPKYAEEYEEKHVRNVEETEDSYIIEFGKSDDVMPKEEDDEYIDVEKVDSVPSYIQRNAKRGLSLLKFAGGGLTDGTKREARAMARGSISDNKVVRMNAWFLRHSDDLNSADASAYLRGDRDRPTAGQVAWLLWGGDLSASNRMRAQKWAAKQVARIERERESASSYNNDDEEKGNYDEEKRSVVSFNVKGKKYFGSLLEQGQDIEEIELLYKSEDGNLFNTGTKISLPDEEFVAEHYDAPSRIAKKWSAQAPITDTKIFDSIKDENGSIVDYQNVTFKGYASTNESVTKGDRIGDYLKRGAFKKTIGKFMNNPVMLIDHQNSVKEIAGAYTKIYEDKNGLMVEGSISNSPDLRNVRFLVAEGHLKTLSIGGMFLYGQDGKSIEEVNLYEISLVAIPMNPDALFSVRNVDEEFFFKKL